MGFAEGETSSNKRKRMLVNGYIADYFFYLNAMLINTFV
jgi:hypothetical protein